MENCDQEIQNTEGANCCAVIPNFVTRGGKYIGGAKYTENEGQGQIEPSGLTYEWEVDGEGNIIVCGINEQIAMFEFNDDFVCGVIKAIDIWR